MKFTAAIMLVALLTAFVVMITAAGERNDEARTGSGYGSGCPDPSACTTSCKAQGFLLGVCLQPLLQVCLCSLEALTYSTHSNGHLSADWVYQSTITKSNKQRLGDV
ncbi:uncharacterized protein [Dermacentor andersoni]|uniref:uncharacterized protein n=1 Tax=Dermacentor andersoni TaxID=34620 RepID=UPI0024164CC9|nr:uncharacterized protein LOC129380678 [Dermacentor andersoni]